MSNTRTPRLGEVEQAVMERIWADGPLTAEACRAAIARTHPMKESTIRTVLRRLELKGYVAHSVVGRTYVYRAAEARGRAAVRAVKHIMDRFWGGSAEELVLGLVDQEVLTPAQLQRLQDKIAAKKRRRS